MPDLVELLLEPFAYSFMIRALAVSIFVRSDTFPFNFFFGTFTVLAIVFHLKPPTLSSRLLDKINEAEKDYSDDESQRRIDPPS